MASVALVLGGSLAVSGICLLGAALLAWAFLQPGSPVSVLFVAAATVVGAGAGGVLLRSAERHLGLLKRR